VQDKEDNLYFTDPVDDTVSFEKVVDNIYKGPNGKTFILTGGSRLIGNDTFLTVQYYKDVTDFLDLKSYGKLKEDYFQSKNKVYMWWGNSDGNYPIEVPNADPKTFEPFKDIAGGKDKQYVFYGGAPSNFEVIPEADPESIRILNPERGCWNCGNCYFVDNKHVYYGSNKVKGADPKTFKLINQETIDAVDKRGRYFDGHLVK
jgi:hypothetical protein